MARGFKVKDVPVKLKSEPEPRSTQKNSKNANDSDKSFARATEDDTLPTIHTLKPQVFEFTNIFPAYPKTLKDGGYAYIIEPPPELLNEKSIRKFHSGLQYSLTGGVGARPHKNIEYFSIDGNEAPMMYSVRQCAGNIVPKA